MDSKQMNRAVTWSELIQRLEEIFSEDEIDVDEVQRLMTNYESDASDWRQFAKYDKFKYTRNLVHEGNGKFNLMLLCWGEGNQSTIHDHANAHCFMKILDGGLREVRFHWPAEKVAPDGSLVRKEVTDVKANDVIYMNDDLGLHRVDNPSHSSKAVSLHLYSPPFKYCQIFDERTAKVNQCQMTFFSKYGKRHYHSTVKMNNEAMKEAQSKVAADSLKDINEKAITASN